MSELLGTKLRALYQPKKGRDLFDLATALNHSDAKPEKFIDAFHAYMAHCGQKVTRAQFEDNFARKLEDKRFTSDIEPLLADGYEWDLQAMAEEVRHALINLLAD